MPDKATDKQRNSSDAKARRLANLKPFQKGVSGNPKGRPKQITLSEAYRGVLAEIVPNHPEGRTFAEVIARLVCVRAAKGDVMAAREIADRTEGKPKQAIDVDMKVTEWREMARASGLSEQDVIREAQRLIAESALDSGNAPID